MDSFDSPWIKVKEDKIGSKLILKKIGMPASFKPSEMIYFQGELSNNFYYLQEGRVKVFLLEEDGTEKTFSIHEPGCFFGEASAIDQLPRPCNACALTPTKLIVLSPSDLVLLMQLDSEFFYGILQSLTRKIRMLTCQVSNIVFLGAEQRIAYLLLKFAADFGIATNEGIKLSISFTDQDLSGIVGNSRVTVTKTLNTFKREGLIKKKYRNITILNQMGLLEYLYPDYESRVKKLKTL